MKSLIKLNPEQLAYLKSLDSKKKKRKFLLDCLIENIEISKIEMHFSYAQKPIDESEKNEKCVLCQIFPREENSIKCESCSCAIKHVIQNDPFFQKFITKPNYSTEEIELAKHNINQREVAEQGSELLKFDKLKDEFDIQEDKDIKSHEYCNTIINFSNLIVKCVNMQSDPTNILNQFLLSVNKYYYYKTKNTIDFIDKLFPQLKNNQSAK